jgi:serine protease Do
MNVADQIRTHGKVEHGRLGVTVQPVDQALAENFGLKGPQGALVGSVQKDSPAAKAGVEPGDVIVAFNGQPIARSQELPPLVAQTKPGSAVKLDVWRDGKTRSIEVTVGKREGPRALAQADGDESSEGKLGVVVRPMTPDERQGADGARGVVVEEVTGPAAKAGVRPGDVILSVNRQPVASPGELKAAIDKSSKTVALLIQRDDARIFVPVRIG